MIDRSNKQTVYHFSFGYKIKKLFKLDLKKGKKEKGKRKN